MIEHADMKGLLQKTESESVVWCLQIMQSRTCLSVLPSRVGDQTLASFKAGRQASRQAGPPVPANNARSVLWCKSVPTCLCVPCFGFASAKGKNQCLNGDGCDISTSLHASRGLQASTLHAPHSARGGGPISIFEYLCTQSMDRAWGALVDPVIRCWNLSCARLKLFMCTSCSPVTFLRNARQKGWCFHGVESMLEKKKCVW